MISILISHPLIPLFLLANLAIGFWAHRKSKAGSFDDYALASRSLPTPILVMALLGIFLSTGHFSFAGWVAKHGVLQFIPILVLIFVCLLIGTFLSPYFVYFPNMKTTGDLMGHFYGYGVQVITGMIGVIFSVVVMGGQLTGIGSISHHLLGINPSIAILFFGGIVVLYSISGMRAVSYTDVLQMIIIIGMVLWLMQLAIGEVGGLYALSKKIPSEHSKFFSHPDFFSYLKIMLWSWIVPIWLLSPPIIQRMLMAGDKKQVRRMWYIGSFFLF